MSGAYYNENDPKAAAWLRALIKAGLIALGEVDERSIENVQPKELRGFTQCHFFAGIGVWSYALRNAGWSDDTPVWTGSCPCQSFSASGKGEGFSDKRHLWPSWFRLIRECEPHTIFGEQVAAKAGLAWLDVVSADLEGAGYAIGTADLCAAGIGAPHIRQRLFFVAHSERTGAERSTRSEGREERGAPCGGENERSGFLQTRHSGDARNCPNPNGRNASTERLQRSGSNGLFEEDRRTGNGSNSPVARERTLNGESRQSADPQESSGGSGIPSNSVGAIDRLNSFQPRLEGQCRDVREWRGPGWLDPITARSVAAAGATRGFWQDCDWWYGRDGKYRPIGPGLFPLVTRASNRMVKLRGYGNALNAEVAKEFIEAYLEVRTK